MSPFLTNLRSGWEVDQLTGKVQKTLPTPSHLLLHLSITIIIMISPTHSIDNVNKLLFIKVHTFLPHTRNQLTGIYSVFFEKGKLHTQKYIKLYKVIR